MRKRTCGALLSLAQLFWPAGVLGQIAHQHHPARSAEEYIKVLEDPGRDEWQKPNEVIEKLELKPGDVIADLGAGSGYFTVRLARAVGRTGKVFAVDIDAKILEHVGRRSREEHLDNIETLLAEPHDPKLAPSSVDMIFICDTLHHIERRNEYYPLLARALRPGGRFVNIDFEKRPLPVGPPVEMKIAKEAMIKEVGPAGFHPVSDFDFLKYQYFLVFSR